MPPANESPAKTNPRIVYGLAFLAVLVIANLIVRWNSVGSGVVGGKAGETAITVGMEQEVASAAVPLEDTVRSLDKRIETLQKLPPIASAPPVAIPFSPPKRNIFVWETTPIMATTVTPIFPVMPPIEPAVLEIPRFMGMIEVGGRRTGLFSYSKRMFLAGLGQPVVAGYVVAEMTATSARLADSVKNTYDRDMIKPTEPGVDQVVEILEGKRPYEGYLISDPASAAAAMASASGQFAGAQPGAVQPWRLPPGSNDPSQPSNPIRNTLPRIGPPYPGTTDKVDSPKSTGGFAPHP